ncbi:MAG: aminotransferase class V-fold PLP-dependent enzyme, partial [Pseudomonadota bacterium]
GGLLDLVAIGAALRAKGAALVIDASQSLGALHLLVDEVRPDFLITAGYKWMLCPYSFSYLYVAPHRQDGRPLEENPANRKDGENFPRLADYTESYAAGARRFDAGERAHFSLLPAARVVLKQLDEWGTEAIQASLTAQTTAIAEEAAVLGLNALPLGRRAGHFIGLRFPPDRFPEGVPATLTQALAEAKVYLSVRGASLRVTPHLYNGDADRQRLFRILQRVL